MVEQLKSAALQLSREVGSHNLTREMVCERAGIAEGSFSYLAKMPFGEWIKSLGLPDSPHPITRSRLDPSVRKDKILLKTKELSAQRGYMNVPLENIAKELDVTPQLIKYYFINIDHLRDVLMEEAVKTEDYELIAQGVINRHPIAMNADMELKTEAIRATMMK